MEMLLGQFLRDQREHLQKKDKKYSLRQVAARMGINAAYLSRIERGEPLHLSEEKAIALARDLSIDADVMLALNGKISKDVQEIIKKRPQLFAELIRNLKEMPDNAILRIVRVERDGNW